MGYKDRVEAKDLLGKIITSIDNDSDQLVFYFSDDSKAVMFHDQDCCEQVSVEDIAGDLEDLIGNPLLQAEESTSNKPDEAEKARREKEKAKYLKKNPGSYHYDPYESETWTFYKFATIKGSVTIRWYGSSNGYYSESVQIELIDN